jgi:hypothetical protein
MMKTLLIILLAFRFEFVLLLHYHFQTFFVMHAHQYSTGDENQKRINE